MRSRSQTLLLAGLALAASCSDEADYVTGVVVRPSGMAFVDWSADPMALGARGDLFVADPEAGGVSVVQFERTGTNAAPIVRHVYVRSPSLYFPLVLPAPGYPTHVAAAPKAASRLYALSPVDARLHVYAIGAAPYAASITESNPYTALGELDLATDVSDDQALAPGVFRDGIVVDLEVLSDGGSGADRLLMVVDSLTGGPARLVSLSVTGGSGGAPTAQLVASTTVAAGPRQLALRTEAPAGAWLPSVGTSSITFVPLVGEAQTFGAPQRHDAGGPTSAVVDAGPEGAIALRLDRARAVLFDRVGDGFARRTSIPKSLYMDGTEGPGELALRAQAVTGRYARVTDLTAIGGRLSNQPMISAADRGADGRAPAVFLSYTDGGGLFLVGSPLRWPLPPLTPYVYTRGADRGVVLDACPSQGPVVCDGVESKTDLNPFACDGITFAERGASLDVVYRGAFVRAPAQLVFSSSTASGRQVELALDADAPGYAAAAAGDRVFVALAGQKACGSNVVAQAGEGSLTRVGDGRLEVLLDEGPLARLAAGCGTPLAVRAEVFAAGPEFVLDRGAGGVSRLVATATAGGFAGRSTEGIVVSFSVTATAACVVQPALLRACEDNDDCPGASCTVATKGSCGGRCGACAAGAESCWIGTPERRCPTASVRVDPFEGGEVRDGFQGATSNSQVMTLPDDAVFSSVADAWLVSFPGSRSIGQIGLTEEKLTSVAELE
jgi:hypothetical protein